MYIGLHVSTRYCCQILIKVSYRFSKNPKMSVFIDIRPEGAELFHVEIERQADGQT